MLEKCVVGDRVEGRTTEVDVRVVIIRRGDEGADGPFIRWPERLGRLLGGTPSVVAKAGEDPIIWQAKVRVTLEVGSGWPLDGIPIIVIVSSTDPARPAWRRTG